jgi:dTDP-4-dehydrorhamnose 3,5-epimerase
LSAARSSRAPVVFGSAIAKQAEGKATVKSLSVEGAWVYEPRVHHDVRGNFSESFRSLEFEADLGYALDLKQVNCSVSHRGVIRGIHVTEVPPGQAKYVFCPSGAILDVVVDLRVGSPTFAHWEAIQLDEVDRRAVFLEHGLGHAFTALSEKATAVYLCTSSYAPATDHEVYPLDPQIGIAWPRDVEPVLSDKDAAAPELTVACDAGWLPSYADCKRASEELRTRRAVSQIV